MILIADVFAKSRTPRNLVGSMSKNSGCRGSLQKQDGKWVQSLLRFELEHLYEIYYSMRRQLNYKKSLLVTCKILRVFSNILSVDGKYSLLNTENSTEAIQMKLSQRQKTFCQLFSSFLKSSLNFEHFQTKDDPHSWYISEVTDSEKCG